MSFSLASIRLPGPAATGKLRRARAPAAQRPIRVRTPIRQASEKPVSVRAAAPDDVKELADFKQKLAQDLASKQKEWSSHQSAGGGVASGGVDTAVPEKKVMDAPDIPLLDQNTFYDALSAAGDSLVVVDFYTDWCGPCKLIYPTLCSFQLTYPKVKFFKFNCNKENKDLGKKLGIKVAPTFHLYRRSNQLAVMTGAKTDQLEALIKEHM